MVYPNWDLGPVQSAVQTVKVLTATVQIVTVLSVMVQIAMVLNERVQIATVQIVMVQIAAIRSVALRNVMADRHCQAEKAATVAHSFVVGRYVAFRRVAVEARFVEGPRREAPVHFVAAVVDK